MDKKRGYIPLLDIFSMAWANFDVWVHSPRTIIMMLFVLSECIMLMKGLSQMMVTHFMGAKMHLIEMMAYRMSEGCNLAMMSILLLVTNLWVGRPQWMRKNDSYAVYLRFCSTL